MYGHRSKPVRVFKPGNVTDNRKDSSLQQNPLPYKSVNDGACTVKVFVAILNSLL